MKRPAAVILSVVLAIATYQGIRLERATNQREALRGDLAQTSSTLDGAQREIAALRLTDAALRAQVKELGGEPVVPEVRVAARAPEIRVVVPEQRSRPSSSPRPTPTPRPCLLGVLCL